MFTLGEAAKKVGKSKTTLTRAIDAGRLSARRKDDGSYEIDPAELFRVYEEAQPSRDPQNGAVRDPHETPSRNNDDETVTRLQSEIDDLKRRLQTADADRRQAEEDRRNEITRVTALLTHEQESSSKQAERLTKEHEQATAMARELGEFQARTEQAEKARDDAEKARVAAEHSAARTLRQEPQKRRWSLFG